MKDHEAKEEMMKEIIEDIGILAISRSAKDIIADRLIRRGWRKAK